MQATHRGGVRQRGGVRVGQLGLAGLLFVLAATAAKAFDWAPFEQESVIEILTHDEDGALRKTSVWVAIVDDSAYVRTNASRWLENIERNPQIQIEARGYDYLMRAEAVKDAKTKERVEEAFKEKYGLLQSTMSLFRFREPTVLRLIPRTSASNGS